MSHLHRDPLASPPLPLTPWPAPRTELEGKLEEQQALVDPDEYVLKALTREQWDALRQLQREIGALAQRPSWMPASSEQGRRANSVLMKLLMAEWDGVCMASAIDERLGEIRG